jgi:hypothetical protein
LINGTARNMPEAEATRQKERCRIVNKPAH